jgi:hypothetical protein
MRSAFVISVFCVLAACTLSSCGDSAAAAKAQKAAAKAKKDQGLLALAYPKSSGALPKTVQVRYDPTSDRTQMTLQFTGLRAASGGAGALTLTLTSSHKGKVRASDNPEGSVDASAVATSTSPGALAFAGSPGVIVVDGQPTDLIEPASGGAYLSAPAQGGTEETVRCRIPTPAVVAAANAATGGGGVVLRFGGKEFALSPAQIADLREFAARLDPTP